MHSASHGPGYPNAVTSSEGFAQTATLVLLTYFTHARKRTKRKANKIAQSKCVPPKVANHPKKLLKMCFTLIPGAHFAFGPPVDLHGEEGECDGHDARHPKQEQCHGKPGFRGEKQMMCARSFRWFQQWRTHAFQFTCASSAAST